MHLVDLSHAIESGMVTYPGLPEPQIRDWLTREASRERYGGHAEFHIGRIDMIANTGTYLDTPFHRFAEGADALAGAEFTFSAVPVKVRGMGTFPVRAFAMLL